MALSIIGVNDEIVKPIVSFGWIEIISLVIFFGSILIGNLNMKFYLIMLVFNIIALPSSVDNLIPSVLISSVIDSSKVYFSLITHIDIFLIFGILRYGNLTNKTFDFPKVLKGYKRAFILSVLLVFISTAINIFTKVNIHDILIILANSFHVRYALLLILLFNNTAIIDQKKWIFTGITISFFFLIFEASWYSFFFNNETRLISGTLRNNTFANIMVAVVCLYFFLIIRGKLHLKYLLAATVFTVAVILTSSRSAILILLMYLIFETFASIWRVLNEKSSKKMILLMGILLASILLLVIFRPSEKFVWNNFKIKQIDLAQNSFEKIVELEENKFTSSLILRQKHYQTSFNMISSHPYFGIGPGLWNKYKSRYGSTEKNLMDSHNDLLATMSQYGIVIALFFCFCMYMFPYLIFKYSNIQIEERKKPENYLFIINIVMFFAGLTNAGLFKHQIFGFLTFILIYKLYSGAIPNHKYKK